MRHFVRLSEVAAEQLPDHDIRCGIEGQDGLFEIGRDPVRQQRPLDPRPVPGAGNLKQVIDGGHPTLEVEHPDVRVPHLLVTIDEPGDRRVDVTGFADPECILARLLPVDDGERELVLGAELADHRLPGGPGRTSDGLDRNLVVGLLRELVVGRAKDPLTRRRDRLLPGPHAVRPLGVGTILARCHVFMLHDVPRICDGRRSGSGSAAQGLSAVPGAIRGP